MDYEKNLLEALANLLCAEANIANSWKGYRSKYQKAREYIDYLSKNKHLISELDLAGLDESAKTVEVFKGMFIEISAAEEEKVNSMRSMAMRDYDSFRRDVLNRAEKLGVPEVTRSTLMFAIQSNIDSLILDEIEAEEKQEKLSRPEYHSSSVQSGVLEVVSM